MDKRKKLTMTLLVLGLAIALCIVGMLILPDVLTVQISLDGQAGNTVAKPLALLAPGALTVVCAVLFYVSKQGYTYIGISLAGLLVLVMNFLFNL